MTTRILLALGLFASVASAMGCKPRDVQVAGDVFVVTREGQNIKLGLVEVGFIQESLVTPVLAKKGETSGSELAKLRDTVRKKEEAFVAFRRFYNSADLTGLTQETMERAGRLLDRQRGNVSAAELAKSKTFYLEAKAAHEEAVRAHEKDLKKIQEVRDMISADRARIADYESGTVFARDLPAFVAVAKSDADGKFATKLAPGTYVAVATASREIGEQKERYCWLVRVKVSGGSEARIMLSNDNLATTMCEDCLAPMQKLSQVVAGDITPQKR